MMELLKKHIHMNRRRGNVTSQMTLDDDFNVPDSMDDVEELIMENGEVKIDSVKNPGEKAEVSGKLEFRILYRRPGGELTALAGSIPFTETVHMPGLSENDYVQAGWELDDLNVESHQFEKAECQGTRDAEPQGGRDPGHGGGVRCEV